MPLTNQIVKTKFFIPLLTRDHITRKGLSEKLDRSVEVPITLVSAPTGYGKSTLISSWLQNKPYAFAWLSLTEQDNNLNQFLVYFLSAIRENKINFGQDLINLLNNPEPPSIQVLVDSMLNSLSDLEEIFILVLDDYHFISDKLIHKFISELFTYPQPFFRLILITRRDPGLPLSAWRAKNYLADIRAKDLRFSKNEILEFLTTSLNFHPDESSLTSIESITEGWISGIRMLILSIKDVPELDRRITEYEYQDSYIFQDLLKDILNRQSARFRDCLLRLSLLKEFNAELFNRICLQEDELLNAENIFADFVSTLTNSNMFIIALDEKHTWYRFHHLFTEMLVSVLQEEYDLKSIKDLRIKAAEWFAERNVLNEAIEQYLLAENHSSAVIIFKDFKKKLLANAQWQMLESVYQKFPEHIIQKYSILLLTKAWLLIYRGNIPEMLKLLKPIESLILKEQCDDPDRENSLGEVYSLKAWDFYHFNIDLDACLKHCEMAIKQLDKENILPLAYAWIFYGGSMQALDRTREAYDKIYHEIEKNPSPDFKVQLYLILCYLDWLEGNLQDLRKTATFLINIGIEKHHKDAIANGYYFMGLVHYYQNDLNAALAALSESYKLRYHTILVHSFFSGMALAYTHLEMGNITEIEPILTELEIRAIERGGPLYVQFAKAASAELHWKSEKKQNALEWARKTDFQPLLPMTNFTSTQIVQIKILAQDGSAESLELARKILSELIPFLKSYNNTNFLIRAYVIQALVYFKLGEEKEAYATIRQALKRAETGGFIRPVIELGEPMVQLLSLINEDDKEKSYADVLIEKINLSQATSQKIILTSREIQILELLDSTLTNKELGNKLYISEKTVKRHIANLFKKLQAGNRQEALSIARSKSLV